jgi:hypothetical protein
MLTGQLSEQPQGERFQFPDHHGARHRGLEQLSRVVDWNRVAVQAVSTARASRHGLAGGVTQAGSVYGVELAGWLGLEERHRLYLLAVEHYR